MAYPPPPGTNNLPARPPASSAGPPSVGRPSSGFKPAFNSFAPRQLQQQQQQPQPRQPAQSAASSYGPSYPGAPTYSSTPSYGPSYPSSYGGSHNSSSASVTSAAPTYSYPQHSYGQPQSYGQPATSYGASPQIRIPFPTPGTGAASAAATANQSDYDPEMAAQIAQWQSAYSGEAAARPSDMPKTDTPPAVNPAAAAVAANQNPDKKKTVVREGGGKKWTDDSLLEWDPSHLRLFVGNLAGETTDDSLLKAFARWKSVQKARVIRDKRTNKSKGYGFVSFSDADDFFQSAKEMNGKYIQSHPVVVRKANTEIKVSNAKTKDAGGKYGKNNKNRNQGGKHGAGGQGGGGGGHEPHLGPAGGAGVTKPGQKTKNGLRLLG